MRWPTVSVPRASARTTWASGPLGRPMRRVANRPSIAMVGSEVVSGIGGPPRFPVLPCPHDIEAAAPRRGGGGAVPPRRVNRRIADNVERPAVADGGGRASRARRERLPRPDRPAEGSPRAREHLGFVV